MRAPGTSACVPATLPQGARAQCRSQAREPGRRRVAIACSFSVTGPRLRRSSLDEWSRSTNKFQPFVRVNENLPSVSSALDLNALGSSECSECAMQPGDSGHRAAKRAPVLPPNSLCSHYSFQGRGSRSDFHRNVRRGAGNFPVSYAVFTTLIRVNPAAIHVVPFAKNGICLV